MLRIVPTVTLILLLLCPLAGGTTSQEETRFKPLEGLSKVFIAAEKLDSALLEAGLSAKELESQALIAVRRDIPSMAVTNGAVPYLMIIVSAKRVTAEGVSGSAYVAFVSIEVRRPVTILSDDWRGEVGPHVAIVWDKKAMAVGNDQTIARVIRDGIDRLLKEFAADYYRDNP